MPGSHSDKNAIYNREGPSSNESTTLNELTVIIHVYTLFFHKTPAHTEGSGGGCCSSVNGSLYVVPEVRRRLYVVPEAHRQRRHGLATLTFTAGVWWGGGGAGGYDEKNRHYITLQHNMRILAYSQLQPNFLKKTISTSLQAPKYIVMHYNKIIINEPPP